MHADGLYVATTEIFVNEWGIFVPCDPEKFKPTRGTDPSFESLGGNVFSYYFAG
jgi:hypothetical protein